MFDFSVLDWSILSLFSAMNWLYIKAWCIEKVWVASRFLSSAWWYHGWASTPTMARFVGFGCISLGNLKLSSQNATLSNYLLKSALILLNNFLRGTFFHLLLVKFIARATICCIIGWLHPCSFCHSELGQFLFLRTT